MSFSDFSTNPANEAADDAPLETTSARFRADVLEASMRRVVLVDFWAPWCGPCRQLAPGLERLVKATGGKARLVKMNVDDEPEIAAQLGVKSIPAVVAFQRGRPADGFVGLLPDSQIKGFLERLVGPIEAEADAYRVVEDLLEAGDLSGAEALRRDASVAGAAAALENALRASALDEVDALRRRAAANPDDAQALFDLALALNVKGLREEAAAALLDIVRRDRSWNDDGARKQLVQFFEAWGPTDKSTASARRKLSSLLFS